MVRIKLINKAFTLTEVLVVVAVISVLVLMAIWAYRGQVFKGYDSRRKTDIYSIKVALEEYEKDHNCYPDAISCKGENILKNYLPTIPCDPRTGNDYIYVPQPGALSCHHWFWIFTSLENNSDKDIEKLNCDYGCGPSYAYDYYITSPNAPEPDKASAPVPPSPPVVTPRPDQIRWGCINGTCQIIPGTVLCDPNWTYIWECQTRCPQNACIYPK